MSETERTPLLGPSTSLYRPFVDESDDVPHVPNPGRQHRQRSTLSQLLLWFFVLTLVAFFVLLIFFASIWVTLKGAPAVRQTPESIVSHAIRWRTTSVELQSVSGGRISLSVRGEFGVDTDWVLGIDRGDDSAMAFARRAAGRWLVSTAGGFHSPSPVDIIIRDGDGILLLNCTAPRLNLPVKGSLSSGKVGMTPVEIPVQLLPSPHAEDLIRFAESTWTRGFASVNAAVPQVTLQTLHRAWWLPAMQKTAKNISQNITMTCRSSWPPKTFA